MLIIWWWGRGGGLVGDLSNANPTVGWSATQQNRISEQRNKIFDTKNNIDHKIPRDATHHKQSNNGARVHCLKITKQSGLTLTRNLYTFMATTHLHLSILI